MRFRLRAAEDTVPFTQAVPLDELPQLIDDRDGIQVAFTLRLAPGKQPVSAQHHAIAARRLGNDALEHHAQLKAMPGSDRTPD
jgi:hypothetical protein